MARKQAVERKFVQLAERKKQEDEPITVIFTIREVGKAQKRR